MINVIIKTLLTVLSGVGVGKLADKVAPDKVPAEARNDWNIPKILFFVGSAIAGTLIVKFIGKKLNIKILK